LGPQDYLPPNPKRAGPTIPPGWNTSSWNRDATAADQDYTNAQAPSDAGAAPLAQLEMLRRELARNFAGSPSMVDRRFERLPVSFTKCLGSKGRCEHWLPLKEPAP
jgi:hypothetical protein